MARVSMATIGEFRAVNWQAHKMGPSSGKDAFVEFEKSEQEREVVSEALCYLQNMNVLQATAYDEDLFFKFCSSVHENFLIPWTGISPRMRRAIYGINACFRPEQLVCAGVFCGYTFICNAGAGIGPGACYEVGSSIGIEILPIEAERARSNVERFAPGFGNSIVCEDASNWLNDGDYSIDLLYIDAKSIDFDPMTARERPEDRSSVYLSIVQAAIRRLRPGSLVLAHNSVNAAQEISDYLEFVRGPEFKTSINLIIDDAGLEVSVR